MSVWRNSLLLLIIVIATAMAVINVRHQVRVLTVQLEQARTQEQQLLMEYSTRQVQQVANTKNDKIAEQVTQQGMQRVNPSVTYYMTPTPSQNKATANGDRSAP